MKNFNGGILWNYLYSKLFTNMFVYFPNFSFIINKVFKANRNLRQRALAVCGLVASLGSPGPALLTARTLNWYWLPSSNLGTVPVHMGPSISAALTKLAPNLSFISMIYPVIGAPPSLIGGSHLSLTMFSDQSTISGRPGAAGASGKC